MAKRLFFLLVAVIAAVLPAYPVLAQVPTPPPTLSDLKLQYRTALSDYRTKEDQFSIAAQQYYTLKTLASEDVAVKAAREVGLSRVDTLLVYIQALRTTLDTKNGIELSRKTTLQNQFDLLVDALKKHRSRLEIATDRLLIENENNFMEGEQPLIQALCYEALSLIKLGAAQAALDQLIITKDSLDQYIASAKISETARSEKQRGSAEIGRNIDSLKTTMTDALTAYDKGLENPDASLYSRVQEALGPAYSSLTQSLEFVKELSQ